MTLSDQQLDRYARHIILKEVGGAGQQRLLRARVLMIGAGGLGSAVLPYLAAAGIGTLGVVDDDVVALSNLQRQILHDTAYVDRPKTESAAISLARINPGVRVIEHRERFGPANAAALVGAYDLVVDGSDTFETRFLINDACYFAKRTLVSAALGRFEGQLATYKPHAGDYPCYRCLFPGPPAGGQERSCAEGGILGAVAGVMGTLQAVEVLKEVLGLGESLAGRMLIYDALRTETRTIRLRRDPGCPLCGSQPTITALPPG